MGGASAFNGDISSWDVMAVTDNDYMWYGANHSVTEMWGMFSGAGPGRGRFQSGRHTPGGCARRRVDGTARLEPLRGTHLRVALESHCDIVYSSSYSLKYKSDGFLGAFSKALPEKK